MTLHVPEASVQLAALKVPVEFEVKVTVPTGVTPPVPELSATVAVQVEATLSSTLAGEHATVVVDALMVDASVKVPLLPLWTLSPP